MLSWKDAIDEEEEVIDLDAIAAETSPTLIPQFLKYWRSEQTPKDAISTLLYFGFLYSHQEKQPPVCRHPLFLSQVTTMTSELIPKAVLLWHKYKDSKEEIEMDLIDTIFQSLNITLAYVVPNLTCKLFVESVRFSMLFFFRAATKHWS